MPCKFHFPLLMLWEWKDKEQKADVYVYLYPNIAPKPEALICFCPVHYPVMRIQNVTFPLYKIKMCSLPLLFLCLKAIKNMDN